MTDREIVVQGLRRLLETLAPGLTLDLPPQETTMWTVRLGAAAVGPWRLRWPKADFIALSRTLPEGSEYTLAIRPADRDLDRLRAALRKAGVRDS